MAKYKGNLSSELGCADSVQDSPIPSGRANRAVQGETAHTLDPFSSVSCSFFQV